MRRILVYDHLDSPLMELSPNEVQSLKRHEEINGEHSMTIVCTKVLEKGMRVLTRDGRQIWREHVVYGTDEEHARGDTPVGSYYCVWSVMHDLMGTQVSKMPGAQNPTTASVALTDALSGTNRWQVGTVTNPSVGSASMYDTNGWDALGTAVKVWGGEIDVAIGVSSTGVVSRRVDWYEHQGESVAKRRFDFGADLKSVRRKVADGPLYCRISPRGKGEQTEGGYGRKITIEEVNDGLDYLENAEVAQLVRLPDGNGGYEYPTLKVENQDIETPDELLAWGLSVLDEYTTPKVTYTVNVIQAAREGIDLHGVSLGDVTQVVDERFHDMRLSARVVSIDVDMLNDMNVTVKLGNIGQSITSIFGEISSSVSTISSVVESINGGTMSTDGYIERLIERLNAEINALGGYVYITQGFGFRSYDVPVSDPTVGTEASQVVEIKGGTLRIANTKSADGDWEWKTIIVSGHVAAEMVTALNVTAGWIQGINGTYIDLDSGTVLLGDSAGFHLVADANELGFYQGQTRVAYVNNEMLYVPLAVGVNAIQVGNEGQPSWQWKLRRNGNFQLKWVGTEE